MTFGSGGLDRAALVLLPNGSKNLREATLMHAVPLPFLALVERVGLKMTTGSHARLQCES